MTDSAMFGASIEPDWAALDARLRPFLRRRLPSAADVDDVMQEVLLRVLRGLPNLADEARLPIWMVQIARNSVADFYRRRGSVTQASTDERAGPFDPRDEEDDAERARLEQILASYVSHLARELPEPYREAIRLTELEGLTQREAAERLGVPLSTLKSRVQRGRDRIRADLDLCCRVGLDARGQVQTCEPLQSSCGASGCNASSDEPATKRSS